MIKQNEYLDYVCKEINAMDIEQITTQWGEENAILIEKFYRLGPLENRSDNDFFNTDITRVLETEKSFYEINGVNHTPQIPFLHIKTKKNCLIDLADLSLNQNDRLYLYSIVNSSKERQALIYFRTGKCSYKLWINGKIIAIGLDGFCNVDKMFCNIFLEGSNTIFIEILGNKDAEIFFMRISDYEYEAKDEFYSMGQHNYFWRICSVTVVHKGFNYIDSTCYEFMLLPNDLINISTNQKITISVQNIKGDLLDTFDTAFYTLTSYDLNKIRSCITDSPVVNFRMKILFQNNKDVLFQDNWIITDNIDMHVEAVMARLNDIGNQLELYEDDYINVCERVKNFRNTHPEILFLEILFLHEILNTYDHGLHFKDIITLSGVKYVYYKSMLDDQVERYFISVPEGYEVSKKYPLVVHLSTGRYSEFSLTKANYTKESVIFADISGRGVTTGSYIGESAILEVINIINSTFSVDPSRVYLTGFSNGAFACWSLAQAYPHLFAAIAPISGGPYIPNLINLSNIKIINFSSEVDYQYEWGYKIPTPILESFSNYTGVLMEKGLHNNLEMLFYNWKIVDFLLSNLSEEYPKKVCYRTERERHNKAYWVEINSIEKGKKYARIDAEIIDEHTILISEENIQGVTLTVPNQVNKELFTIRINDTSLTFTQYKENSINLIKRNEGFKYTQSIDFKIHSSKGMGLLDVYMDSMKIVIPNQYDCISDWETIKNVAERFSKPLTQGWDSVVYVNYPILDHSEINQEKLTNNNLILIGINEKSKLINQIRNSLPIKLYNQGYEYNDIKVNTKYCIFQLCKSPFSPFKKVLTILANDVSMLKKCMFTRNVILSSYANGLHNFLNNEALIFDEQGYSKVYSWGDRIEPI